MSLLDSILVGMVVGLFLSYFVLIQLVLQRDRVRLARRRPIDEILRDALAEGRITEEEWSERMDEIHRSMPSLDAPYPKAREFEEHRL